jgi:hypothetical protein
MFQHPPHRLLDRDNVVNCTLTNPGEERKVTWEGCFYSERIEHQPTSRRGIRCLVSFYNIDLFQFPHDRHGHHESDPDNIRLSCKDAESADL